MLTLPGSARLFLYQLPMDMRKSFEGLSLAIEQTYPGELLSGAYFIFLNKRRNHIKVLYFDSDGLVIFYKRLEKGTFCRKNLPSSLKRREFIMLIEGITPKKLQPRFSYEK